MLATTGRTGLLIRYLLPASLGAFLAVALHPVWGLEGRWFFVAVVGIVLLAVSMMFAGRFSEFVMIALLFSVPVAGFTKWIGIDGYSEYDREALPTSGMMGLGITDFMLAGLYMAWVFRIFVIRTEPVPRPRRTDFWVVLLVVAAACSIWGAREPRLGVFALEHVIKHALVYFYVSRNFRREHVNWLLASIAFSVALQAVLGFVQGQFGRLRGIMADKGAGGEKLDYQYEVPGIENVNRAMGTTYDSHALGLYMSMLIPFALVFCFDRSRPLRERLAWAALLLAGLPAVVFTYSRSGWLSCAIALGITFAILVAWRERGVLQVLTASGMTVLLAAPFVFSRIFGRFTNAPEELLRGRFEQFPIAWSMWRENLLFGVGGGNYMIALKEHNMDWAYDLPVHNVILFLGAEVGIVGVLGYYGLVAATAVAFGRMVMQGREPERRIAAASLAALAAMVFDGMSNPHFREPTLYLLFWILAAIAVAFTPERSKP